MASDATPIPRRSSRQRWAKGLRRAWARRMRALARALNPQATAKRSCVRSPRFRESVVTRDPHFWCRGASLQATPEPSLAAVRPSINRNFVAEEGPGRRNWRPRLGGGYNRQAAFGGQRLGTTQRTLRGTPNSIAYFRASLERWKIAAIRLSRYFAVRRSDLARESSCSSDLSETMLM